MLEPDKTQLREERHHITQEDFTPDSVAEPMAVQVKPVFMDFSKTVLDNSCGIGNLLCTVLCHRLQNCGTANDAVNAVRTLYGVELMADNVQECRSRLYCMTVTAFPSIAEDSWTDRTLKSIIKNRIQWGDSLRFDYDNWPDETPWTEDDEKLMFLEPKSSEDTQYPMWHKEENDRELTLF